MTRQTAIHTVRLALVGALLVSLLATTAGTGLAAAPSIAPTPGTAKGFLLQTGTFIIPFAATSLDLDVDCGTPTSTCSVWVARNNAAKASEVLFTNVTGSRGLIPVGFINDGCFNFRLYDSAHGALLGQINVGHGEQFGPGGTAVCNADGTAAPAVLYGGSISGGPVFGSGVVPSAPAFVQPISWDSGFAGGVEVSEVWIVESKPNNPTSKVTRAFTDCASLSYPNAREVLYARNVSGEQTDLNPIGGGPYCFTLYQGTAHATRIAGPTGVSISAYLQFTADTGKVYFNSGNGSVNALVCVYGTSIPGSDVNNQVAFTFNSEGWNPGGTAVTFQGGGTTNTYTLRTGITNRNPDGSPTNASCVTGAAVATFTLVS